MSDEMLPVDPLPEDEITPDVMLIAPEDEAPEPVAPAAPVRAPRPPLRVDGWAVLRIVLLVAVLVLAAWLRLTDQNWDDYTHLHPDERFLTQVIGNLNGPLQFEAAAEDPAIHAQRCAARYPDSVNTAGLPEAGRGGYFDADCSPLNPNNVGNGFYVYGEFPLFTVRLAGEARTQLSYDYGSYLEAFDPDAAADYSPTTHWTGYNGAQLVGRTVAAVCDLLTVLILFLLGRQLYGDWVGLLAAALYGVAAFPIQQSQFWTVDAFTTMWVTLGIYFAARALMDAGVRRGPLPLPYLAIWAIGTGWETAYWHRPVLGLVTLGGVFALVLLITLAVSAFARASGRRWGDALVASSGVVAALAYLVGWAIMDATAEGEFSLANGIFSLGLSSLLFALVTLATYAASVAVRHHALVRPANSPAALAVGAVGVSWLVLVIALLANVIGPWSTLAVALAASVLLIADVTEITDYVLFGVALGGAVAARVNVAPLAAMIVVAAVLRSLPLLDARLAPEQRARLISRAMGGLVAAGVVSLVVFRLLQPHAFMGPGLFGLKINVDGWWADLQEASYEQSGQWDVPPNYQWVNRADYLFPWRNIVEWGFGVPLGLAAWAAWVGAGGRIVRGKARWAQHVIPFLWILGYFGWLGGRWVTSMRYFLPIYPALALFGAWGLWSLAAGAYRAMRARPALTRRLAFVGATLLLVGVYVYTALFGYGMHKIHATQLTRVAASRWFQEFVPGDFGVWVEGDDGTRQLANLGVTYVAPTARVYQMAEGDAYEFDADPRQPLAATPGQTAATTPLTFTEGATLEGITFQRLGDPDRDDEAETVRVRILYDDPALGRQVVYADQIEADLDGGDSPYGRTVALSPDEDVVFDRTPPTDGTLAGYVLQITALDGGPVMFSHGLTDMLGPALSDVTVTVREPDGAVKSYDFNFPDQPLLTGYGDDIPIDPTQWTVNGRDTISFAVPIDGTIDTIEIPHLGDVLTDADAESVTLTVETADGQSSSATITDDFSRGANPLGPARTVTLDEPLRVTAHDTAGNPAMATLVVEAHDPIYTSGPVVAWEGSWDDPVPWPVCPLPNDMVYTDDAPSGLSSLTCLSLGMYGSHYQGIQLWMAAEDNQSKLDAMMLALDQADYLVITSNRFYDTLTREPMRWPMSGRFYDALFDDDLGYALVKTFESYPSLGPVTVPDEILPIDDLPDWLNEQWEAEEAYHVYDHPVVYVYRKTTTYSSDETRAILEGSGGLRAVSSATASFTADPEPVDVVPWPSIQVDQSPTMLQLDHEKQAIQRDGGTWSDLFDMDSLVNRSQVAAVLIWWLVMILAGWLAWPLLFVALPALPDRGYPVAKLVAWLLVAWAAWAGGTLNILTWTRPGLAVLLLALAALSALVLWRRRAEFGQYVRAHWRHLLAMELLTGLLFLAFLGVRLGNPDLWHSSFGGEKPMDFAYFNAVLRSTVFPPIDPWHAGGYMNYYYFGYVLVGAPVKLIGVRPAVAYNLILPTLYAMTGVAVFSIAYNWVKGRRDGDEPRRARWWLPLPRGNAWLAGITAMVMAVMMGNLGIPLEFVRQVSVLDGYTQRTPLSEVIRAEQELKRQDMYNANYQDAVEDFRDEYGYEPTAPGDMLSVQQQAQTETDAEINDAAMHPPLTRIWSYGAGNLADQIGAFVGGLGKMMDGQPLQVAPNRWYWGPRSIITELPNGTGGNAIAEMPYFTFVYGDLHAHMLSMPIYLFALLWLLSEVMGAGRSGRRGWETALALILGGLAVGVLRPTNSWDWITFLILGPLALTYAAWVGAIRASRDLPPSRIAARVWNWLRPDRVWTLWPVPILVVLVGASARIGYYQLRKAQAEDQAGRALQVGEKIINATLTLPSILLWIVGGFALVAVAYVALVVALRAYIDRPRLLGWLGGIALFAGVSFLAALPFTRYFATAYTSVQPWTQVRTPLWAYLYIHGAFLFVIACFLLWQTVRILRRVHVRDLDGQAVPVTLAAVVVIGGALVAVIAGAHDVPAMQVSGPLLIWAAALFFVPNQHPRLRLMYPLIVLGLALTLGVELVVLSGDIGRQNTVFKFYLQAWFFFSVISGVAVAWMLHASIRWRPVVRVGWQLVMAVLLTIGLLYPILATQGRFMDRFNAAETPLTLDGMEYMKYTTHGENGVWFSLEDDYQMIRWFQANVEGSPVAMEAHQYPSEYHWNGRISIYTGLPTILGWRFHQIQQHSLPQMDVLIQTRENNINAFYTSTGAMGIETAWRLIDFYDVEYIVVGLLERATYGDILTDTTTGLQTAGHADSLAKFDQMVDLGLLEIAYEDPGCLLLNVEECPAEAVYLNKVYHVVPGAALPESLTLDAPSGNEIAVPVG
ncbi:DUF2298 domain-containing protein [Aggregatilinea lenta]|uniref:DUF2298 domain-containing protein n=1 Tax=Aggregatilinea lenta TaxID=913108 RepID=UPI0013C30178|nr:DUF2298 domain-containing protein [Aggregatilinea lenta]